MSEKTGIEWCDATWNVIVGCTKATMPGPEGKPMLREGCRNCYAIRESAKPRLQQFPQYRAAVTTGSRPEWTGKLTLVESKLGWALLRKKEPLKIFVNAFSDLFHESLPPETIARVFEVMCRHSQHTFMVLTKRPERMKAIVDDLSAFWPNRQPPPNVWLGVSVEDQASADYAIPFLMDTDAAVRWISAEPLLAATSIRNYLPHWRCEPCGKRHFRPDIDLGNQMCGCGKGKGRWGVENHGTNRLQWVVVGGESGPNSRPMTEAWALRLMQECDNAGVAFFMKQGSQANWPRFKDINSFPPELRIREWPQSIAE